MPADRSAAEALRDRMDEGSVHYRSAAYALLDENERLKREWHDLRAEVERRAALDGTPS